MGGRNGLAGISGVHTHMSNTRNTPVEAIEHYLPVRIRRYGLRQRQRRRRQVRGRRRDCARIRNAVRHVGHRAIRPPPRPALRHARRRARRVRTQHARPRRRRAGIARQDAHRLARRRSTAHRVARRRRLRRRPRQRLTRRTRQSDSFARIHMEQTVAIAPADAGLFGWWRSASAEAQTCADRRGRRLDARLVRRDALRARARVDDDRPRSVETDRRMARVDCAPRRRVRRHRVRRDRRSLRPHAR